MRNLQAGYGTFRTQTVMNAVAQSIDQTSQRGLNVDHQIIIYSDFAVADWSDEDFLSPAGLDEITKTCALVDRSAEPGPNLAISDLRTSAGRSTVGQSIIVEASVRVLGQASPGPDNTVVPRKTNVELIVDGVLVARRPLNVIGSEIGTISFDVPVDRNGSIPVTARIDDSGLLADDQRHLVIVGQAAIQVLVVDGGNQSPNPLITALSGTDKQGSDKPVVELATIEPSQLATARLDRADVITLTGMSSIDESQRKTLVEFTRRGGRLLISLGEIAERATWQALLDDLGAGVEITDGIQQGDFGFDPLEFEHPAIGAFRDFPDAGLLDVPIYRYHPTVLTGPEIDRILNYDDGHAAIATFAAGQGRVALTTTPLVAADPDSPWNNLPAWWSYVPLVNELVFWLFAGEDSDANRTSLVGQGLVVDASEFPFSQRIEIRHSNGDVNFVSPNADTIFVEPHQVVEPGFVEIGADQGETAGASPAPLFAFNFDLQESDTQSVDVGALQSRLNQEPASSDFGQAKSIGYRDRWPLQLCLAMLLMLLVVEWALASRTVIAVRKEAS